MLQEGDRPHWGAGGIKTPKEKEVSEHQLNSQVFFLRSDSNSGLKFSSDHEGMNFSQLGSAKAKDCTADASWFPCMVGQRWDEQRSLAEKCS